MISPYKQLIVLYTWYCLIWWWLFTFRFWKWKHIVELTSDEACRIGWLYELLSISQDIIEVWSLAYQSRLLFNSLRFHWTLYLFSSLNIAWVHDQKMWFFCLAIHNHFCSNWCVVSVSTSIHGETPWLTMLVNLALSRSSAGAEGWCT